MASRKGATIIYEIITQQHLSIRSNIDPVGEILTKIQFPRLYFSFWLVNGPITAYISSLFSLEIEKERVQRIPKESLHFLKAF